MRLLIFSASLLLCSIIISCQKDKIPTQHNIVGNWRLIDVSGGKTGQGMDVEWDVLEIREDKTFQFNRKPDSQITSEYYKKEAGIYILTTKKDGRLEIEFGFLEDGLTPPARDIKMDNKKFIEFDGPDQMELISDCCDRFNYHLERI